MIKYVTATTLLLATLSFPANALDFGNLLKEIESNAKTAILQPSDKKQSASKPTENSSLTSTTVNAGLKQALEVGAKRAIAQLSQKGGYFNNSLVRIAMPGPMQQASKIMRKLGLNDQVDQFELSMNRAAEKAVPQASELILNSLNKMSLEDAMSILNGPDDAATEYFRQQTQTELTKRFKPEIKSSLASVGATSYYNQLAGEAKKLPLVGDLAKGANLEDHVTDSALNGLFKLLALEEKKIRQDPIARSTELLKQVFSN